MSFDPSAQQEGGRALRRLGQFCTVSAAIVFAGSLAVFTTGLEVAILPMLAAFGLFTFGIGSLAASKRK